MSHEVILVIEDQKSMALYLQERLQQVCDLPVLACYSYNEKRF